MSNVTDTYQQIALERPHICSGCLTTNRLSHSHLIPRSFRKDLEAVKENIVYHCLSIGHIVGCHEMWEGVRAPFLKDFIANMAYIYKVDQTYYWKKFYKLEEYWNKFEDKNEDAIKARTQLDLLSKLIDRVQAGMV